MISNGSELKKHINSILQAADYRKKQDTWYCRNEDMITFFHTEKSPWSGRYDYVIGLFLAEDDEAAVEYPLYYKCGLKFSLGIITDPDPLDDLFDLENTGFTGAEREEGIDQVFKSQLIPLLTLMETRKGIMELLRRHEDLIHHFTLQYRELLGIDNTN